MVKVKIYIEGGGDSSDQDISFREAWTKFFHDAGLKDKMPRLIRGKGREKTFDLFRSAVRDRREDEFPLMLVDSEEAVKPGHSPWQHLKSRDKWDKPKGAGNDDAFLMICCMETWLISDRGTLKSFFPGLNEKHLPKWPKLEEVPRRVAYEALRNATKSCARQYEKGEVSFRLLAEIDPKVVEQHCPAAKRLLDRLRDLLS